MNSKKKLACGLGAVVLMVATALAVLMLIVPQKNEAQQNMMVLSIRSFAQIIAKANDPIALDIASKALMGNVVVLNLTTSLESFKGDAQGLCIVAKRRSEFLPKMTLDDHQTKLLTAYFERAEQVLEPSTEIHADIGVLKPCLNPL